MIEALCGISLIGIILGGIFLVFWYVNGAVGTGEYVSGAYRMGWNPSMEDIARVRAKNDKENQRLFALGIICFAIGILAFFGGR